MPVNIHEAKTHFSKLIEQVLQDEEVVIAKAGHPVARLTPIARRRGRRVPGSARGKLRIAADFDAPLPPALQQAFR